MKVKSKVKFGSVLMTLICNEHGYADYNVVGHPQGIRRVKLRPDLKVGDIFNVYSGESTKNGVQWLGSVELSLRDNCLEGELLTKFRVKVLSENYARKQLESIFEQYEQKTGIRLSVWYDNSTSSQVVFEGVVKSHISSFPSNNFKNTFDSLVDMREYFNKIESGYIKTINAQRVLQMMDSCEDGHTMYCEFANLVANEVGISRVQIDKELDPFV